MHFRVFPPMLPLLQPYLLRPLPVHRKLLLDSFRDKLSIRRILHPKHRFVWIPWIYGVVKSFDPKALVSCSAKS